jgi:general secretion pathway protein G
MGRAARERDAAFPARCHRRAVEEANRPGVVVHLCPKSSRSNGPPRCASRRGFTIIELLSVMAIIGVLSAMAVPRLHDAIERARIAKAIGDLRTMAIDIQSQDVLPASLAAIGRGTYKDPWGRPYQYLPFPTGGASGGSGGSGGGGRGGGGGGGGGSPVPGGARKDRFLVPINSAFDLYSLGPDGVSAAPLTAAQSRDDIIVANDGGFIGPAIKF